MTHNGGTHAVVAPDGKWLYYSVPNKGLWKMPADGGEATLVLPPASLLNPFSFVVKPQGIYAVGAFQPGGTPVVFYPFDEGNLGP